MVGYRYTQPWFLRSELRRLADKFIDPTAKNTILEVGCFEGLSSVFFSDLLLDHPGSSLVCVDPFLAVANNDHAAYLQEGGAEARFDFNIAASKNSRKVEIHKTTSDSFFALLDPARTFSFIYVDGCHECDFIQRDLENSFRHLERGGIMWMDDYLGGGDGAKIKPTVDAFVNSHKDECSVIHQGYQLAVKKAM